ncbi:myb/SANT-like DNA-binding domain-containing protein 4 isoform X2 [Hemibagrus wyckioides]|uniref:myb/SANT-like DNA-binding domain-containing protein 4 isoform X2 n=1 Tax=Hemibagrus wyckioides TaxID=337641 RepID=UPI00266D3DC7|nr:myb/SANT-like DNA-binding domain-containing protein 4 isoform X2 [Hemibagrus wyckioides]
MRKCMRREEEGEETEFARRCCCFSFCSRTNFHYFWTRKHFEPTGRREREVRMSSSTSSSLPLGQDGAVRYKKRKANFTFSEVHILLDEVRKNRHIVVGKFNSGIPSDVKRRKWTEITQRINEIGECDREVGEVIKKWSDLKCDTKRKIAALHSGVALPHSSDLTQTENIVSSILELDKKPWEATRSSRGRSRSEDQDTTAGDEDDDVAFMGPGSVQDSPRSGIETRPMLPPLPGAATGGFEMKFDSSINTDADSRAMDSDDDHHDIIPSSVNNSYTEDEGNLSSVPHVSSSSTGHAQAGTESESTREQLAQSASLSVQEQHVTNALLCTVSRSLELLAESVQQLAETQQEFARESLRLQRETVQVLREFASGALTLLHERVNGKPPLI